MARLPVQAEMARWRQEAGVTVEGLRLFEVGTGHVPLVPMVFFLYGAGHDR